MSEAFLKGNEALVCGAVAAGCRAFFGYPITPASEIANLALQHFEALGNVAIQAESEVAAINMVYGAASAGVRCMTATSSPGFSLMQEGISYIAAAQLPCVIVNVMRGGPGLGNIAPEQGDYFQTVKGGGHGCYHLPTFVPHNVQEMSDLCMEAFELADKYRTPVCILADAFVGQMMESCRLPDVMPLSEPPSPENLVSRLRRNPVSTLELVQDDLERRTLGILSRDQKLAMEMQKYEAILCEDAEVVLVAYGICARIAMAAVEEARSHGWRLGLVRPVTVWPFPLDILQSLACGRRFVSVELGTGQMIEDIRLALNGKAECRLCARCGGNLPSVQEILDVASYGIGGATDP